MNKNKANQTQLNHPAPEEMGKINRRTFCACMAGGVAAGAGLVSCGEGVIDNFTEATLTLDQVKDLESAGYLNLDEGAIVVYRDNQYNAFTRVCPHEGGNVLARSADSFQCLKHPEQFFDSSGKTNGAKTPKNLPEYNVTKNGDGTLFITRG